MVTRDSNWSRSSWFACAAWLLPLSSCDALALSASPSRHPYVGCATRGETKFVVIGTSHFRCKSPAEVSSLIEEVKPDGVVIELDPERALRLTKEGSKSENDELLFGADFQAAIDASRRMDVPLFLGDEYVEATKSRLIGTALSADTYGPGKLWDFLFGRKAADSFDLLGTLFSDPLKLAPLLATVSPPVALFVLTIRDYRIDDGNANAATLFALSLSFLATCKVFNALIADRDEILASSAINAGNVISSLKRGETIRMSWNFTMDYNAEEIEMDRRENGRNVPAVPLFTLKTPLLHGKVRNLNLFEPRWLKMIDGLTPLTETSTEPVALRNSGDSSTSQFGCVTCTNKFYSAVTVNGAEGRYADVIFERKGRMAALTKIKEGRRPSGARKVLARIEGGEPFELDEKHLSVADDGYLVASHLNLLDEHSRCDENQRGGVPSVGNTIVVVVGLLHAYGLIRALQQTPESKTE